MPCIRCTVNQKLNDQQRQALKEGLMEAIQQIPGKTPDSLMIILQDAADMCFHRDSETACAFVEVNALLRKDPSEHYPAMSKIICELLTRVAGIAGTDVYIRYLATPDWGWNGTNF
ncbi:hypothetical protein [Feifania hominis]|uniref:Macrophage migration inhibitory factor n=1 Tax=Feifania hominis TaxID=2763660 RepID=A0A926DFG4_9FIRM|nr:hypothetical protein [Feifania hominis]MBC8537211.1 hypothetical protein [Feifania hominis]